MPKSFLELVKLNEAESESIFIYCKYDEDMSCPRCGSLDVFKMKTRPNYQCRDCRKQFSLTTGTLLTNTNLPISKFLIATWLLANTKNGIGTRDFGKKTGLSQHTSWGILSKIRAVM